MKSWREFIKFTLKGLALLKIEIAEEIGFCFGVDRAVKIVESLLYKGTKVYVTGELIHNADEMKRLTELGLCSIDINDEKWPDLSTATVVIRAHGIPIEVFERLKDEAQNVIDATCPVVITLSDSIKSAEENGFEIFLYGHEKHDEVQHLKSVVKQVKVVESYEEIKNVSKKIALFSQTTMDIDGFSKISGKLGEEVSKLSTLLIKNSICHVTLQREREVKRLAKSDDLCLIVGGKNSSNTKKLFDIAKKLNTRTYLVLDSAEINEKWFDSVQSVGICSGTSTPQRIINDIVERLRTFKI
jgi:4-hydroxy-3-methylbut-2-enyl diphosphate reductase